MLDYLPRPVLAALLKVRDGVRASPFLSNVVYRYLRVLRGPVIDAAWLRSFREGRAIDVEGRPLPWIVYGAIAFLAERVRPEMTVFEYGAGNSTCWWAERVAGVTACESDAAWVAELVPRLPGNARLLHVPLTEPDAYVRAAVDSGARYHILVVDGRERVACVRACLPALREDGVLVLDNSDRRAYRPALDFLEARGFRRLDFRGMGPIATIRSRTSIFHRPDNCLGIESPAP